jgi:hypothetical protein
VYNLLSDVNVCFAPKATKVLRCRELTRCAMKRHSIVGWAKARSAVPTLGLLINLDSLSIRSSSPMRALLRSLDEEILGASAFPRFRSWSNGCIGLGKPREP